MLNPKFDYGCEVRVIKNIRNDTYQGGQTKGEMLIRRGVTGFVRQSGVYQQDQIIYQVHFLESNQVIGCRESELVLASDPWMDNKFEYGDDVLLNISLSVAGELVGQKGHRVNVLSVDRSNQADIFYRIQVGAQDLMVPERALIAGEVR